MLWLTGCQSTGHHLSPEKTAKSAKIHFQLGINALYSGDLPKAFEELMRSNKILPKQPEVLDSLAYAWRVRGDNVKAEALYRQSLAIHSRPSTETNFGSLLVVLKRYGEAEVHLHIALQDPRYQKQYISLIHLGDALLGQHRFNSAIQAYQQASSFKPSQNISKLREAAAYVQTQRFNDAQALYERMLNKDSNNRPALEGLIAILVKQHQIRTARQYMARYIEKEKKPLNRAWANDELIRLGQML
ncbi:MAG: tetratricopeptide repeat protein [Mariprofundaceae bacterium]|nr:tetratricopeptide repeat protein [Mariprofundaceae bacterium]